MPASPFLQPAFVTGEISPSVFGRIDLDREHVAASTMRNLYVNYRGGAYSRAGTRFVGFSKQTGRDFPPRLISFQFSINQGLSLEFGHEYMRVILDGAFATEDPVAIGSASQTDPCALTFGSLGALTAAVDGGVATFSYAPGDLVTLTGGAALQPAVLLVTASKLASILTNLPGTGYAINDTITLGGGTHSVAAVAKVLSVVAVRATGFIAFTKNPSDGDTVTLNGVTWTFKTAATTATQTTIQSTLAGTLVQLELDLNASTNGSINVATYNSTATRLTVSFDATGAGGNAYTLAASVATPSGGTLTGGTTTGCGTLSVNTAGVYTVLPPGGNMTQTATSGGGAGASFQTAVFGPQAVSISNPGAYTVVPISPVGQDSSTGGGLGATFTMTWGPAASFNNDDWIFVDGVEGMTELNGGTFRVAGATPTTVSLLDIYGDPIDATAFRSYTGGGTAARIFTLPTIYDEQDLEFLKFVQSADVMSICCVNQDTGTEYPPQDLARTSDTDWAFSPSVAVPTVSPPSGVAATITATGTEFYQYQVTAVSQVDGSESIASATASVTGVSIAITAGQVNIVWTQIPGVNQYNIYKAQPSLGTPVPAGSLFGYIGSAYGAGFSDTNILPDFAQVPPLHIDPFARGQIIGVVPATGGSGYTTATATITTATGSSALIGCIVQGGAVVGYIVQDNGVGYQPTDTVAISGDGTGATATLQVGAESGTYPSVVGYFQERRVYANTLNERDTYFMSQPGSFGNFDSRIPPIDTDAIVGSPWSVQVNGIQWVVQTSGGLLVMTGASAWLLVGAGSFATNVSAISPANQDDVPQAFTGVSPTVPPIKVNYDVLYVNAKGSFYYALPYQLYVLSEPVDLTEIATHLFADFTIIENAWCEQPSKLLWAVRSDGVLLSLTYYKSQSVAGWARHDTNGFFVSVCTVTEPPVDALYVATQRFPGTHTAYMVERMDNRLWKSVEDVWAVDAALRLTQPTPNAALIADSSTGAGTLTGVVDLVGGVGYSAGTTATVVDDAGEGPGAGAVPVLTIDADGTITAVAFAPGGTGYVRPALVFIDPANTGSGASATVLLDNSATFTADADIFGPDDVGAVIRMGGGIATVTAFIDTQNVTADIISPIVDLIQNSGGKVAPQPAGTWTLTHPVTVVAGLDHLIGATVTGLADGNVITPRVVASDGTITLDTPASSVTVGLGFTAQLQGTYFEGSGPTSQGQRKKIAAGNVLVEASRGLKVGGKQLDGSALSPPQLAPEWKNLSDMDTQPNVPPPPYNSDVLPLYTGYFRIPVQAGFTITGQVALEQDQPLPMNILGIVSEALEGDRADQSPKKERAQQRGGAQAAGPPPAVIAAGGR